MKSFKNRQEAGRLLAKRLAKLDCVDPIVLALPRGGVPVGFEVAKKLSAPLDVVMVRKLGAPLQPELAVGAVVNGDDPQIVVSQDIADAFGLDREEIHKIAAEQLQEIRRRRKLYLKDRRSVRIRDRTAIVVDDGIATGSTFRAALKAVRRARPKRLILAVPVAPSDAIELLRAEVDDIACLSTPWPFYAVGAHYIDFRQVSDHEVASALERADEFAADVGDNATSG